MRRLAGRASVGLALLALAGCVAPQPARQAAPGQMALTPVGFAALPGWQQDNEAVALAAFRAGCAHLAGNLGGAGDAAKFGGSGAAWQPACDASRAVAETDSAARGFFEVWFQPYAILQDGNADGLFTGYYEPEVRGSRAPGAGYEVPLLGKPGDLVSVDLGAFADDLKGRRITGRMQNNALLPYYDRAEIEAGALRAKRLEFLWLADPVDAFFLEIQGSGRVRLPDGRVLRVTYAGQNGRPYVPIGRVLIERGEIPRDQVSLQTIRAWLEAHPAEARSVMDQNPSFVFFRELTGTRPDEGPPGALGAALTPGRSLAVDRAYLPLGAPVFVDTTDPLDGTAWRHLGMAQDLGGAIKGAVRADIFFGWGADAEARAGQMRGHGRAFVLLPRG
jgi:membrane-bound lytic murein transglycosylase A